MVYTGEGCVVGLTAAQPCSVTDCPVVFGTDAEVVEREVSCQVLVAFQADVEGLVVGIVGVRCRAVDHQRERYCLPAVEVLDVEEVGIPEEVDVESDAVLDELVAGAEFAFDDIVFGMVEHVVGDSGGPCLGYVPPAALSSGASVWNGIFCMPAEL